MPAAFATSSMDVLLKPCRVKTVRAVSRTYACLADSFTPISSDFPVRQQMSSLSCSHLTKYTAFDNHVDARGTWFSSERGSAAKGTVKSVSMDMREFGGTGIRLS